MATWLDDVVAALTALGGVATYSDLYEDVRKRRVEPLPPSWEAIVRRTVESHSSDSQAFEGNRDLFYSVEGLGKGVWGLRDVVPQTPHAADLPDPAAPPKTKTEVYRILRDTVLARSLKKIHKDRCQLCGHTLHLSDGSTYSEAHHIRPLGGGHDGPDIAANILVLCPNHHVLCDYGALLLRISDLRLHESHAVGSEYLDYHNREILKVS